MKQTKLFILGAFIAATFIIFGCTVETPHFKKLDNVKVVSVAPTKVKITADLIIYNPNKLSFTLKEIDVDVISSNDQILTNIKQNVDIKMPARSDFSVPIDMTINPMKVLTSTGSILGSALSALKTQEIELLFRGNCKVEKSGIGFNVPIDSKTAIKL